VSNYKKSLALNDNNQNAKDILLKLTSEKAL
jgi:hypothetical protein